MAQNSINNTFLGVGAEDAFNIFLNSTPQTYAHGIDTSDANSLKITDGATPSAGNIRRKLFTTGERILPAQPSFGAATSGAVPNVTGNGTNYVVIPNSEFYDIGGNYDNTTGLFTAPVTGTYRFSGYVVFGPFAAGHTSGSVYINGPSGQQTIFQGNPFVMQETAGSVCTWPVSGEIFLTATQTASLNLLVSGGTQTVAASGNCQFSGVLLC